MQIIFLQILKYGMKQKEASDRYPVIFKISLLLIIQFLFQGFYEACDRGFLTGHKMCGFRFILEDGK